MVLPRGERTGRAFAPSVGRDGWGGRDGWKGQRPTGRELRFCLGSRGRLDHVGGSGRGDWGRRDDYRRILTDAGRS